MPVSLQCIRIQLFNTGKTKPVNLFFSAVVTGLIFETALT